MECYRRLYKAATPSADFDELVKNATIDENGRKVIDFMSYKLEDGIFESILNDVIKEFKINKLTRDAFKTTIYLGCSPSAIRNANERLD